VRALPFALLLFGLIGLDLYTIDRHFFVYSPRARQLFAADAVTDRIRATPLPYRVLDWNTYGWSILMSYGIPQVLGYHGTELRAYDDLLGGKNEWRNLNHPELWRLLAIRYILVGDSVNVPGYHHVLGPVVNALGRRTYLYEADNPPPYVRVVPAAVKGEADRIIPTLLDPRLDYDRLVLFTPDEPVNPPPVESMPAPSPARAQFAAWEPGRRPRPATCSWRRTGIWIGRQPSMAWRPRRCGGTRPSSRSPCRRARDAWSWCIAPAATAWDG
jgi:hypothetical protein